MLMVDADLIWEKNTAEWLPDKASEQSETIWKKSITPLIIYGGLFHLQTIKLE